MRAALPGAARGEGLLIAFSGGPDSLALLLGARDHSREAGYPLFAAHLDHRLDPGSGERAAAARALARRLEVPFVGAAIGGRRPLKESREAYARRARYAFLEKLAEDLGARAVATAHHADDQAETVLLRLLFGSGLDGLGGIAARRPLGGGAAFLVRPLLGLRRAELRAAVDAAGLAPTEDPTNRDTRVPRNHLRLQLLPRLARAAAAEGGDLVATLCRIAASGKSVSDRLADRLAALLATAPTPEGARLSRPAFEALPDVLQGSALSLLHRVAGEGQPAPLEARRELLGQLRRGGKVRCDCGSRHGRNFWWQADRYTVELRSVLQSTGAEVPGRAGVPEPKASQFTYTFEAPGAGARLASLEKARPQESSPAQER